MIRLALGAGRHKPKASFTWRSVPTLLGAIDIALTELPSGMNHQSMASRMYEATAAEIGLFPPGASCSTSVSLFTLQNSDLNHPRTATTCHVLTANVWHVCWLHFPVFPVSSSHLEFL